MTVKVSTSNFYTNFKYKVKSNFRVMVILLILHLVAAPLNLINLMIYMSSAERTVDGAISGYSNPGFNELYPVIGSVSTCLAAVAGIILAMSIFNYLYKKSVVDMTLSLPLTTKQRFFSDFLAGLFTYLVPFVISSILSLIINGIGSSVVSDWNTSRYGNLTQSLVTLIVAGFFVMLMVYILTVLVLTCCGNMFESLAYTILINALIPGTIAVFGYIFIGNLYGIDLSSNIMPIIEKTSPIGALIGLATNLDESSTLTIRATWLIPFILITAVYFIGSYLLYKRRKAEAVSKPFVYKAFYYVMITGMTFCIGTLFTLTGTSKNIGPLIVITAIIYLIFEVITNRGFAKFYMSVIRYVITIAAVIGLSLLVEKTGGFGVVEKIPTASNVKSVEMNYGGVFNKFTYFGDNNDLYTYTDEDTINSVIKMHELVIKNYNEEKLSDINTDVIVDDNTTVAEEKMLSANYSMATLTIKYNLKNGKGYTRTYGLSFDEYILLMNVDKTAEFKDNYINSIKDYSNDSKKHNDSNDYISITDPINYNTIGTIKNDSNKIDELLNCIALDVKALTAEEYYAPTKDTLAVLTIGYYGNQSGGIAINENYASVLMFFKKYNVKLTTTATDYSNQSISITKPEDYGLEVDGKTYYSSSNQYNYYDKIISTIQNSPDLEELLKHIQMNYITTEPCYQVNINGYVYIVPPKYNELAKKVSDQLPVSVIG